MALLSIIYNFPKYDNGESIQQYIQSLGFLSQVIEFPFYRWEFFDWSTLHGLCVFLVVWGIGIAFFCQAFAPYHRWRLVLVY